MDDLDVNIEVNLENNVIKCEVKTLKKELQYAFYLMENQTKLAMRWYKTDNKVMFQINKSGEYYIICFIKHNDEKKVFQTELISIVSFIDSLDDLQPAFVLEKNKTRLSIFGSCVTRDVLEYDLSGIFELRNYFCRQSIVSLLSKPVTCSLGEINLQSMFQKKQIYHDLMKDALNLLKSDCSDYLIIDLIDERFSIIKFKDSFITNSTAMVDSGYVQNPQIINYQMKKGKYFIMGRQLDCYIDEFCRRLLNIYSPQKIIIHKAYMVDSYVDLHGNKQKFSKNYLYRNRSTNLRLEYIYDRMIKKIGTVNVIDLCKDTIISKRKFKLFNSQASKHLIDKEGVTAVEGHKWGLAPMHYCDSYYKNVLNEIYRICDVSIST